MDTKQNQNQTFLDKVIDLVQHNHFSECSITVDLDDEQLDVHMSDERPIADKLEF